MSSKTEVIVTVAGAEHRRYFFEPGDYVIGRDPDCAARIEAELVSRHHARLTLQPDGWFVEDLGSANGTLLDGVPVTSGSHPVQAAQTITVGAASIVLRALPAPAGNGSGAPPMPIREMLPPEFLPGRRYAVGDTVASGGMGAIVRATDRATQRNVAMKFMLDQSNRDDLLRFIEEAQITAQLEHPNIVPVHELGINEQDQVFYTMKFIGGITLRKVLELITSGATATIAKYPLATLLTVFQKVCDALAFAHSRGVLHRDLKPDNIMLGDFGEVLVMDWGIAKLLGRVERAVNPVQSIKSHQGDPFNTPAGLVFGTPQYMSPEQAMGATDTLDPRSDIYSLGAVLYTVLTLRPSVEDPDAQTMLTQVAAGGINPPAIFTQGKARLPHLPGGRVPDALSAVVMKAMAREPGARYQTVAEFQTDLTAYQNGFATAAENAGFARRVLLFVNRHKILAACLVIFFSIITVLIAQVVINERRGASLLERLVSTGPILRAHADTEIEKGDFFHALEHIGYAVELAPSDPAYHTLKGNILQDLLRLEEARAAYASALALNPNHEAAKLNLALCNALLKMRGPNSELPIIGLTKLVDSLNAQGRHREAVIVGRSLASDRSQLVDNWKAILTKAGIANPVVRLLPDGRLYFSFGNQSIEDISFLRGAPIGKLEAFNSRIADLSPLKGSNLSELIIDGSAVSDLRPLAGMMLHTLSAARTKVSDLTPLHGMPLKVLRLDHTSVHDLSPLNGVPLESLSLEGLGDLDIAPLAGAPLRELFLAGCNMRDIYPLRGMKLETLGLGHVKTADLSPLQGMPLVELRACELASTPPLSDLSALSGLQLRTLELERNYDLSDLTPLYGMPLTTLKLNSTAVVNLTPLADAPLATLEASHTKVRDLAPLARMHTLRVLKVDYTPIADLTPLTHLALTHLQLNRCTRLRDFAPLGLLHSLKRLSLPIQAQGIGTLRTLPELNWIAYGIVAPESDSDGSRARQFWADYDLEEMARAADPDRLLRPSRFPPMARRYPGIVQRGSHWYLYFDTPCAWTEANELTTLIGCHLATITSKEENDFVLSTFGNRIPLGRDIFLGGRADSAQGTWTWVTGEPWSFTHWARRGGRETEPNGASNGLGEPGAPVLFLSLRNDPAYANGPAWNDLADRSSDVVGCLVEWDD